MRAGEREKRSKEREIEGVSDGMWLQMLHPKDANNLLRELVQEARKPGTAEGQIE